MKPITTLLLILLAGMSYANDSTLYKKRIDKLRSFHEWLTQRPFGVRDIDTSQEMRMYDTVINKFFNKNLIDSLLQIKDDMFTKEHRYYFFLAGIATFNELARKQCFDSLRFKPYQFDGPLSKEDSIDVQNTIVQYFIINGKEIGHMSFDFIEGETTLLYIPIIGREPEVAEFYRNLKPCARR